MFILRFSAVLLSVLFHSSGGQKCLMDVVKWDNSLSVPLTRYKTQRPESEELWKRDLSRNNRQGEGARKIRKKKKANKQQQKTGTTKSRWCEGWWQGCKTTPSVSTNECNPACLCTPPGCTLHLVLIRFLFPTNPVQTGQKLSTKYSTSSKNIIFFIFDCRVCPTVY